MAKASEAQKKASSKYDKENTKQKVLKFNKSTDADILELLDGVTNVQGYIKRLIRNDMNNKEVYKMYTNNEYVVYYTITNQYNEVINRENHEWAPTKDEAANKLLEEKPNVTIVKVVDASKIKHFRVHVIDHTEHWYDAYAETKEEVEQRYANDPMVKEFEVYE